MLENDSKESVAENIVPSKKFSNPELTAKGEKRASVELTELKTLWFNTGTQCNLNCVNCYIESSPTNDRLSFLTVDDVVPYLEEIQRDGLGTKVIGLTGGEPFLNPQIIPILTEILQRGFQCLVLTNAHRSINRHKNDLLELKQNYRELLQIRVSLDHFSESGHEEQRGEKTFASALSNLKWLSDEGFVASIAGRSLFSETPAQAILGYQNLVDEKGIALNIKDPSHFVLFPEMKSKKDVPEISIGCWDILKKTPEQQMCATERMIVKRKGEERAKVLACTLLAYDRQFELGEKLASAEKVVPLNHRFCAEFCVLGGASCSSTV